jgi:hypothetical protein
MIITQKPTELLKEFLEDYCQLFKNQYKITTNES